MKTWAGRLRRRRVLASAACVFVVAACGLAWLGRESPAPLSPDERRLVGRWAVPITDPRLRFATRWGGTISNPRLVQEFRRDRVYRAWIVSGDDPGHRFLQQEGRWRVVSADVLRFEPTPDDSGPFVKDLQRRVAVATGLPLWANQSVYATVDVPYRLPDKDTLEYDEGDLGNTHTRVP